MNHDRKLPLLCGLTLVVALLLSACHVSATTPRPIPDEDRTITVGTIKFAVGVRKAQEVNSQYAREHAQEGSYFTEIKISVQPQTLPQDIQPAEAMKNIMNWQVFLEDRSGKRYAPKHRSWGLVVGDVNTVDWIFVMPNEVKVVWLVLPESVSVDLTHIVEPEATPAETTIPMTRSAIATPSLTSISIQQTLFSMNDKYYTIDSTVKNPLNYDVLVKGLSILGVREWQGLCSGTSPVAQKFLDTFSIKDTGGSNLKFQGAVIDEAQQDYKYPIKGSYSNQCSLQELKLEFNVSFIIPAARSSSFHISFPRYLKLEGSSNTMNLPIINVNLDDGTSTPQFDRLTFTIHTAQEGTASADILLAELYKRSP